MNKKHPSPPIYNCDANWAQFEHWNQAVNRRLATMEQALAGTLLAGTLKRVAVLEQRVAVLTKTPRRPVTGKGNVHPIR